MERLQIKFSLPAVMIASVVASAASGAKADAIRYSVVDLGSSYSFSQDAAGNTTAVTSSDGKHTYEFDKFPVSYQNQLTPGQIETWPGGDPPGDIKFDYKTNQFGSIG